MQLFKALQPIQVLSFDLDDTLYDNKPVIAAAEQAMLQALALHAPQSRGLDSDFWWQQRKLLAKTNPEIRHDIGRWRLLGLEAGLLSLGLAHAEAGNIAKLAYAAFLTARTRITLQPDIIRLLSTLAQHYRLIAITNGNASIHKMGVGELFEFSLQAGPDGRMKPYADLFLAAANRLQVKPGQILHIGDSHRADVLGALSAGCQAAWLDHHQSSVSVLPHIRLTDVQQLQLLLSH
ncbi:HAD-IA family hydrolase [Rheinheimera nanhaiensis]|uniref:HAD family hydrolase n=1 Tax=Rheinheimera nanhaiensis E407-8 TaxID=562729 RepID=I1E2D0_9GAMM|nr:HAD-IA family hydrolase [Rheinheimera nanhaiensis]GAB60458.1 HAD family hydrolase [Rheinheimera nanhaiensis E407-8]